MRLLLLSGLGPNWPTANSFSSSDMLRGTFLDSRAASALYHPGLGRPLGAEDFRYESQGGSHPLLRPRLESEPHLTSSTLTSILDGAGREFELFRLEDLWSGQQEPETGTADVVALSTTFICNRKALRSALTWIHRRYPNATVVVGGQYSNLKYPRLMRDHPEIDFVIRGDAELAFPLFLDALEGKRCLDEVPNLVVGGSHPARVNPFEYVDLESHPSPRFRGSQKIVPYESMRGCPYTCKFCSFPFASPKWRFKSHEKIRSDWQAYAEENGAELIRSMDSTFTVPLTRFRKLLDVLPPAKVKWEAYTRANVIGRPEVVSRLEAARCSALSIGFESMSDAALKLMDKKVTAHQNRVAHSLLTDSEVDFRGSFIVGYPGETPRDFELTQRFLVEEYSRHFLLSVFSLLDETMPVWQEADRLGLEVEDLDDPDSSWSHCGMNSETARRLHQETLRQVRWKNDRAVAVLWQIPYQLPLIPELGMRENYRVEKLLERLALVPSDFRGNQQRVRDISEAIVNELKALGIRLSNRSTGSTESPSEQPAGVGDQ